MSQENEYQEEEVLEVEDTQEVEQEEVEAPEGEEATDWEARAKKAEALIQKNKTAKKAKPTTNKSSDSDKLERMQLQLDGYPKEVIQDIMDLGGKSALEGNAVMKQTVDSMVEQHKAEQASKISSGTQTSFEKKYTQQDLEAMSVEELEKVLPKAQD